MRKAEKLTKGKELDSKGKSSQHRKDKRLKHLNFVDGRKIRLKERKKDSNVKDHAQHLFLKVQYSVCPASS